MKTKCDYGAWIDNKHYDMSRNQWLLAASIAFDLSPEEFKREITRQKRKVGGMDYYNPENKTSYYVPWICAYYHIVGNGNGLRKWWYIQPYGKETSVIHAVAKKLKSMGIDEKQFKDLENWETYEKHSSLDPEWNPHKCDINILLDELEDINYHDLSGVILDCIEKNNLK